MRYQRTFLVLIIFVISTLPLSAQNDEQNEEDNLFGHPIDSAMAISPNYLPTSYTEIGTTFFKPTTYKEIDTTLDCIGQYDPLSRTENIYQTLGIFGQAHKPMNFTLHHTPGFKLIDNPYPLYYKEQDDLHFYKLKTSYTQLAYTFGISNENEFTATHAQNFKDKVNIVFNMRAFTNTGYFTHQKDNNIQADFLLHYEIPSQIYGFRLSYIINYFNMAENGGLLNMQDFFDIKPDKLEGYNVKLYYAESRFRTHDLLFQQYVNIINPKAKKEGKKSYWGTLTHTFQFRQQLMRYSDHDLDSNYYDIFTISRDSTYDTLSFYTISNTLQYSTFQPYKSDKNEKYFLHFTGGVTHEYTNFLIGWYRGNSLTPFAQTHIRLFSVMDIHAKIYYTLGAYQNNDLNTYASVSWKLDRKRRQSIGCDIDFYYLSPEYLYTRFADNHHFWINKWKKQNFVRLTPFWQFDNYRVEFSYFMLKNYVYLDETKTPTRLDAIANVIQLHLYAPFYLKGFGVKANLYLQYANRNVIQVPLFAGKLDFFYRFNIFKGKGRLQLGVNAAYNTGYYADAYYPLLRQFYHQTDVKTGNYFYLDTYMAIQVQRISLFFKVSHVLAGTMGKNYFTTPNYPMQDRCFALGVTWRFHD